MLRRNPGLRRWLAGALATLAMAPLLGALHSHPPDHDGAIEHVEAVHGSHASMAVETDLFLTSTGPQAPPIALPGWGPEIPHIPALSPVTAPSEPTGHPARAPPNLQRSRAPPSLS